MDPWGCFCNVQGHLVPRRFEIGDRVLARMNVWGRVRAVLHSEGQIGVEWSKPVCTGEHDGILNGVKHWDCPRKCGAFYEMASFPFPDKIELTACTLGTVRILSDRHLGIEWDARGTTVEFERYEHMYTVHDLVRINDEQYTILAIANSFIVVEPHGGPPVSISVDCPRFVMSFEMSPIPCESPAVSESLVQSHTGPPLPDVPLHYPLPHELRVMRHTLERSCNNLSVHGFQYSSVRMSGRAHFLISTSNEGKFIRCNVVVGLTHFEAQCRYHALSFPLHEVSCIVECRTNPYFVVVCMQPRHEVSDVAVCFWGDFGAKKAFIAAIATAFKVQIGLAENAADSIFVCRQTKRIVFVFR